MNYMKMYCIKLYVYKYTKLQKTICLCALLYSTFTTLCICICIVLSCMCTIIQSYSILYVCILYMLAVLSPPPSFFARPLGATPLESNMPRARKPRAQARSVPGSCVGSIEGGARKPPALASSALSTKSSATPRPALAAAQWARLRPLPARPAPPPPPPPRHPPLPARPAPRALLPAPPAVGPALRGRPSAP